ncbi:MAG: hypothetical protein K6V97_10245 [Actinomycetia bacterium]|nr:hypothetical protein [Actinomycetes bacterium]
MNRTPKPHGAPPDLGPPAPLRRAQPEGWVRWVFWGLRVYIVGMLVLVAIGFARGWH